jgi:penicillin-binding protein 1B
VLRFTAVVLMLAISYGGFLAWQATSEFEGRRWDIPAQVYAAPLELFTGRALSAEDLVAELKRGIARIPASSAPAHTASDWGASRSRREASRSRAT